MQTIEDHFLVVVSEARQYACWPQSAGSIPAGWMAVTEPIDKATALERIRALQKNPLLSSADQNAIKAPHQTAYSIAFPNPSATARLVVFPHAGSGTSYYHFLAKALSELNIETITVAYPGREIRIAQPACDTMSAMLNDISPSLQLLLRDEKPFFFYGHSMGALIAFELTRRWRNTGHRLPHTLICSGRQAPSVRGDILEVETLSDQAFIQAVIARYEAIPPEILENTELYNLIVPALRADFSVVASYTYRTEPPLPCAISLANGTDDPWVHAGNLEPWSLETNSLTSRLYPGGHFFLQSNIATFSSHMVELLC